MAGLLEINVLNFYFFTVSLIIWNAFENILFYFLEYVKSSIKTRLGSYIKLGEGRMQDIVKTIDYSS